jgi:hypothetical protein
MSFFARIVHAVNPREAAILFSRRRQNWTRPKPKERTLPALDLLEYRQTVSDTFFVSLQAAGVSLLGAMAAEKARDPFGLTNPLDISISGGSDRPPVPVDRGQQQYMFSAPMLLGEPQSDSGRVSGISPAVLKEPTGVAASRRNDAAASDNEDELPVVLNSSVVDDIVPRPHGVIRKLQLAPPTFAVGASATFTADTATTPSGAHFEIPRPVEPPAALQAVPPRPERPIIPAGSNGPTNVSAQDSSETPPGFSAETHPGNSGSEMGIAQGSSAPEAASAGASSGNGLAGASEVVSSQENIASALGAAGVPCPIPIALGPSGGGSSCIPQTLSSSGSLPVLNWESTHGLVAFPGVIEYDQHLQWVELRAQDCDSYCLL